MYLFSFDGIARTMVKIQANVEEDGKTVINPTNLIGSLSKVVRDGELTLTQGEKKDKLSITGTGRKMQFAASGEMDNFEQLIRSMPLAQAETFTVSASTFKSLIRQSAPFVDRPDKDNSTGFNRGDTNLLIKATANGYEACATEGNALAVIQVKDTAVSAQAEDLRIPIRSVLNLKNMVEKMKGENIRVIIGRDSSNEPNALFLRTDNVFYGTALDGAKFRDYQKILNMPISHTVTLPKANFQALISNATPFTGGLQEVDGLLVMLIGKTKIKTTAGKGTETFEEESEVTPVKWPEGPEGALRLAFKPDYLANVARVVDGEFITVAIAENQVIAFFVSEKDDVKSIYAVARFADQAPLAKAA